jgi:hypothetical protein
VAVTATANERCSDEEDGDAIVVSKVSFPFLFCLLIS